MIEVIKMNPSEFADHIYERIEVQHCNVDDIAAALARFNPVRVGAGIGQVINAQHQMRTEVAEHIKEGSFRRLVEFISRTYTEGNLYAACANPLVRVIPQVDFSRAFVEEARGMLYFLTARFSDGIIKNLREQPNGDYYLRTAVGEAVKSLEAAVGLSSNAALARRLLDGAKKYQIMLASSAEQDQEQKLPL